MSLIQQQQQQQLPSEQNTKARSRLKMKRPDPIKVPVRDTTGPSGGDDFDMFKALSKRNGSSLGLTPTTATTPSVAVYGSEHFQQLVSTPGFAQFFDSPRTPGFKVPQSARAKEFKLNKATLESTAEVSEKTDEISDQTPNQKTDVQGAAAAAAATIDELEIRINPSNLQQSDYKDTDSIVCGNMRIVFDKTQKEGVRIHSQDPEPEQEQEQEPEPQLEEDSTELSDDDDCLMEEAPRFVFSGPTISSRRSSSPASCTDDSEYKPIFRSDEGTIDPSQAHPDSIVYRLTLRKDVWDKVTKSKKGVYRCSHCNMRFSKLLFFAQHMDAANLQREYPCDVSDCPWSVIGFSKRSEYTRHTKHQHGKDSQFSCKFEGCDKVFCRKDSMKRHYLLVHENTMSRRNKKIQSLADKESSRRRRGQDTDNA